MDIAGGNTVKGKVYVYKGEYNVYGRGLLPASIVQNLVEKHVDKCKSLRLANQAKKSTGALQSVETHLDFLFNKNKQHTYEKYEYILSLGVGSYGFVYKARHHLLGNVAIKQLNLNAMHDTSECFKERDLLVYLRHDRVVPIKGAFYSYGTPFIVMDLCKRCLDMKNDVSEFDLVKYSQQLLEGLKFIHAKNVIHCDIKMANLLINKNDNLVIGDFGNAICLQEGEGFYHSDRMIGNAGYSDYDVLDKLIYTPGNDIFAAGCVLFAISMKKHLMYYSGVEDRDIYKDTIKRGYILTFDQKEKQTYNDFCERQSLTARARGSVLGQLIILMIIEESNNRPSAQQLLNSDELKNLMQIYIVGQDVDKTCGKRYEDYATCPYPKRGVPKNNTDCVDLRLRDLVFSTFYYDPEEKELFDLTNMSIANVFTLKPEKSNSKGESSAESVGRSESEDEAVPAAIPEEKVVKVPTSSSDDSDSDLNADSSNEQNATTAVAVVSVPPNLPAARTLSEVKVEKFIYGLFRQQPEVVKLYDNMKTNNPTWLENVHNIRNMFLPKKLEENRFYEPKKSLEELNHIVFEWDKKMQNWAKMSGKDKEEMSLNMKVDKEFLKKQVKPPECIQTSRAEGHHRVEKTKAFAIQASTPVKKVEKLSKNKQKLSKSAKQQTKRHESPVKINAEIVDGSKIKRKEAIRDSDEGLQKPEVSTKRRKKVDPVKPKEIMKTSVKSSSIKSSSSKALEKTLEAPNKKVTKIRCKYCKKEFLDKDKCRVHVKECPKKGKNT